MVAFSFWTVSIFELCGNQNPLSLWFVYKLCFQKYASPLALPVWAGLMLKTSKHDCVRLSQPLQNLSHYTVENICSQTINKILVV